MSDPDCILVVVLKNSEPELSYIIGNNFTNMTQILEHTTAKKPKHTATEIIYKKII